MAKYHVNMAFFEIRYRDSLLFNDMKVLQNISDKLIIFFKETTYDAEQKSLILFKQDEDIKCVIFNNRLIFEYQDINDLEIFRSISKQILNVIFTELNIQSVTRIGVRCLRGIRCKNGNEAMNYVNKNYFKLDESKYKELGKLSDTKAMFSFQKDERVINLTIAPNLYKVLKMKNNDIIQNTSEYQILVDSDIYTNTETKVDPNNFSFIDDAVALNNGYINDFISLMEVY